MPAGTSGKQRRQQRQQHGNGKCDDRPLPAGIPRQRLIKRLNRFELNLIVYRGPIEFITQPRPVACSAGEASTGLPDEGSAGRRRRDHRNRLVAHSGCRCAAAPGFRQLPGQHELLPFLNSYRAGSRGSSSVPPGQRTNSTGNE